MATTPEVDGSAAWPCPGKLSKGPACSTASGWGLSCEGLTLHQARAEGQVAECGTAGIHHNPAPPAPRASQCFHEWSHFPDNDWLSRWLRGPIILSRRLVSAWGLSCSAAVNGGEPFPPRRGGREGGEGFYIYF